MSVYTLRLVLPLPPSTNKRLKPVLVFTKGGGKRPSLRQSKEDKAWKEEAAERVSSQLPAGFEPYRGPVELYLTAYFHALGADLSNRVKTLEDALTLGGVWDDDRQVAEHHHCLRFTAEGEEERVEVVVRTADVAEHPELARRLAESRQRAERSGSAPSPRGVNARGRKARASAQLEAFGNRAPAPRLNGGLEERGQPHYVGDNCPGGHMALAGTALRTLAPPRDETTAQRLARLATSGYRRPGGAR